MQESDSDGEGAPKPTGQPPDFEARYRALFEHAPDGILIVDARGRCRDANPAMCRMLGYALEELASMRPADVLMPEEAEHLGPALQSARARAHYQREWSFRRKDGSVLCAEVTATVMPDDHLLAIVRDISERKEAERALRESEAQLRVASKLARLSASTTDFTTGEIKWSDEMCAMRGVPPGTRPTAEQAMESYAPEYRDALYAKVRTCLQDGKPFDFELQMLRPDGGRSWARVLGQAERDETGKVVRLHGVLQDIDEQHKLEERLRNAEKLEAIGRLAGGVAHDFNNMLTVILSYAAMLARGPASPESTREGLGQIREAGERAAALTQQLLAFGRKQVLEPVVLDIGQVVADMEPMLARLLGEDVDLHISRAPALGKVLADASQMEQVVMNLAVNARDAMPRGGTLSIEALDVEVDSHYAEQHIDVEPGSYVMLAVSDTGVGMAPATREHIFEPFFTTKETGKGTGLGLSTVFGIVKQSRGHIWVYSEPGHGTTFKLLLPRTSARRTMRPRSTAPPIRLDGSETILVVEDDAAVRAVICAALQNRGYRVLEASDGEGALGVCQAHAAPIHLLVTDVVMPRMSGRELAKAAAASRPDMRVLYLSGYTETAIVNHGVLEPGLELLPKPITPDALCRRVREILDAPAPTRSR